MNKLSETEKDILCANHDWQNCRLSNDGLDIEAIQNNPSNPENIGEWINMGQLVDYDDELDELSQDEPEDSSNEASTYRIIGQLTYTESEETEDGFKTIEIDEIFKCDAENLTTVLEMFLSAHPEYVYFGTLRGCDPETHGKNYASFYDPNENQIIKVERNS